LQEFIIYYFGIVPDSILDLQVQFHVQDLNYLFTLINNAVPCVI